MSARKSLKRGKVGEGGSAREGSAAWGMMIKRQSSTTYKDRRSGPEPASSDVRRAGHGLAANLGLRRLARGARGVTRVYGLRVCVTLTRRYKSLSGGTVGVTPPPVAQRLPCLRFTLYSLYSLLGSNHHQIPLWRYGGGYTATGHSLLFLLFTLYSLHKIQSTLLSARAAS